MQDRKAQASFEVLLLLTLVFVGVLYIFSLFFQVNEPTLAMQLTRTAVSEKISKLPEFYYIDRIDFKKTSTLDGQGIEFAVYIVPETHGLTSQEFLQEQAFIADKIRYAAVTINPYCNNQPC